MNHLIQSLEATLTNLLEPTEADEVRVFTIENQKVTVIAAAAPFRLHLWGPGAPVAFKKNRFKAYTLT